MRTLIAALLLVPALAMSQNAGTAGAFARLGFGGRGMGMGNAMSAVATGDVAAYYNPALPAFADTRTAAASFGFLSLDRYMNFLSYSQAVPPTAGISFSVINAGVRSIDGRNSDGVHTDNYSITENQFALAFSNRIDERVSLGAAIKLYYSHLFEGINSSTVGFDLGLAARLTDDIMLGAAVLDINSRYKWDTRSIYGESGSSTEDRFPNLRRVGLSWKMPAQSGIVSVEFENSSENTNLVRAGAEYNLLPEFTIRTGIDRWELGSDPTGVKPSFGFTVRDSFGTWTPALTYAFVTESYAPRATHYLTIATAF